MKTETTEEALECGGGQENRAWLSRIAEEFIGLERYVADLNLIPDDAPDWVKNVEREFGKVLFSTERITCMPEKMAYELGKTLGQQSAFAVWSMESLMELEREGKLPQSSETAAIAPGGDQRGRDFPEWYNQLVKLVKRSFCLAVDNDYQSMADYLRGFSEGFGRKPLGLHASNLGNTTFEVYLLLLLTWRWVANLKSVRELHEYIGKVLGPHRTGDLKRVQKICERVGLSYRPPGRPKKEIATRGG
jgi:hypothetical protein